MGQLINLNNLESVAKLGSTVIEDYLKNKGVEFRVCEVQDLIKFKRMIPSEIEDFAVSCWTLGNSFKQTNAEYDAVKVFPNLVLNLDLKHTLPDTKLEKLRRKFERDRKHLSVINQNIESYCFVADTEQLLHFDYEEHELKLVSNDELIGILGRDDFYRENKLDDIDASRFLISPFDQTDDFKNNKYYLTDEQIDAVEFMEQNNGIFGITGEAGTGKTLVGLDLVKSISPDRAVLFVFSGAQRSSHESLAREVGFSVTDAKHLESSFDRDYDVIIVDEAQRLRQEQREWLFDWFQKHKQRKLIFLFDVQQIIGSKDDGQVLEACIELYGGKVFELSKNIRSNANIASFVKGIFDKSKSEIKVEQSVDVEYFESIEAASKWLEGIPSAEILMPLPTMYGGVNQIDEWKQWLPRAKKTHEILGSERDFVATFIDNQVEYNLNGLLVQSSTSKYQHYSLHGQYYINLSRARRHLYIAIVNNPAVLKVALKMLLN